MTAKAPLFDRSFWRWLAIGVGLVVLAVVVVVLRARAKAKAGAPTIRPNPIPPGTVSPPQIPPTPVITPAPTPTPTGTLQQVNYEYIRDLAWKMNDTVGGRGDYACEITNGVLEMGDHDLAAFAGLYASWYGRALKDDYCGKIQNSGCWTSWWDGKHARACTRLKTT